MIFFSERAERLFLMLLIIIFFISSAVLFMQVNVFYYLIMLWGGIVHFLSKDKIELNGALKIQTYLFLATFLLITLSIVFRGEFLKLFEYRYQNFRDLVFVYFISIIFVYYRFSAELIFRFIAISAMYAFVYVILILLEKPERGIGLLKTPITLGNMGMLFGVLSLVAFLGLRRVGWRLIALLGFFSGILLSFLSGSRGGWITVLITFFIVLYVVYRVDSKQFKEIMITSALFVLTVLLLWSDLPMEQKILQTVNSVQAYFNGNPYTSIGFRFEMWKGGWMAFIEKPFWGWGFGNFDVFFEAYKSEGLVQGSAQPWGHPHNDYILLLSETGLIGFVVVLGVLVYPLIYLFKQLGSAIHCQNMDKVYLSLLGIVLIEALLEFMIFDQTITMKYQFHFYVVLILMILSHFNYGSLPKKPQKEVSSKL